MAADAAFADGVYTEDDDIIIYAERCFSICCLFQRVCILTIVCIYHRLLVRFAIDGETLRYLVICTVGVRDSQCAVMSQACRLLVICRVLPLRS